MRQAQRIEKGTTLDWNDEEWTVLEVCLDKEGNPIGYYQCHTSSPWSEYESEPCYWSEKEIRERQCQFA